MDLKDCRIDGSSKCKLANMPANTKQDKASREAVAQLTEENLAKMGVLQEKLYAEGKEGVVVLLQAMDAAGKDSTIKHVMSGINPQGVDVTSFKQPSSEELAHDFLWRAVRALPRRGKMAIFNRSYYEDVLVVRVHELQKSYKMAERSINMSEKDFFNKRFEQIRNFEEYLYENSYRVVKIFLHVSKKKQKERFIERINDGNKNWKFSASDVKERTFFDRYMEVYEDTINNTATKHSPWYVIPADQKWYTRYLVSEAVVKALEDCDPQYPELPQEEVDKLGACREQLMAEE